MYLTLLLGLVLVGLAAGLGARAVTFGRARTDNRLRSIEMYGFAGTVEAEQPLYAGDGNELAHVATRLGAFTMSRFDGIDLAAMRHDLLAAGYYKVEAETYLGYRVLITGALGLSLGLSVIASPSPLMVLGAVVGVLLGWRIPMIILQRRAANRHRRIDRDLPELIDLLVVSVEAGVGLAGALQMIAQRMGGPLGEELRIMLQEQGMGLSSDQSLTKLLERVDTPSMRSFVRSLQQGERLGVSIGTILRNLAVEMRTRRRHAAEEQAQKAPVKILFPLILLIFPAMLIVLAYPLVHAVQDAFS